MLRLKLGLIAALVIGALWVKHLYDQRIADAAVAACETKHREAKAQLVLDYTAMGSKADQAAKERDRAIQERDSARRNRVVGHADVVLPGDLANLLLDDATSPLRGSDAAATAAGSPAVPAIPQTYDAADIARWFADAHLAYDSADADSLNCRARYDGARAAQLKQAEAIQ